MADYLVGRSAESLVACSAAYLAVHSVSRTAAKKDQNWVGHLVATRVEMLGCSLVDSKAAKKAARSAGNLVESLAGTTAEPMESNWAAN